MGGTVRAMPRARALLGLVVACALASCSGAGPDAPPSPAPGALRLVAVGDSITAADSPDFAAGELGGASWVRHVVGEDVAFSGGWAVWGATTAEMAAAVEPLTGDVLVLLAGTNDAGVPFAETADNLRAVVARAEVREVVLCAVPPIDADPDRADRLNEGLADLARAEGWGWVPRPEALSDDRGRFAPGMSSDGLHPSEEGARVIGRAVADALRTGDPRPGGPAAIG